MELLQMAMSQYSQRSSGGDDDEDTQVMHSSLKSVHREGVSPPQESDLHEAKAAHEKVYKQGNTDEASDEELGKAAGVEAFNAYQEKEEVTGESGGQGQLIQMAMAEGMKMFSGGGGADKGAVIQSAIAMAMKLFMGASGAAGGGVSQLMSMFGGGGGGGDGESDGMAGMLGMAASNPAVAGLLQKFM
ncbi:hypothetical protein BGZ58_010298 [Dissophora ornata]|nr:hypothetical protein BGZ58_010298 [Dissophora ornata]